MENSCVSLPKELWEMILDIVEDSKDVLQVLKALPKSDISFKTKKRVWLVGQVIRIFTKRFDLEEKDVLNCRLVCKQWKMRVDRALETQSVLQAYHLERDKEEKDYWKAFDHWNMLQDMDMLDIEMEYDERIPDFFSKKFFGGVVFNSDFTNLGEFLEDMEGCPPHRNPFVGRIVTIIFSNNKGNRPEGRRQNDEVTFWRNCFQVLERYGRHVWHLNLCIDKLKRLGKGFEVNPPLGIWNTILQVLTRLPNLKSVKFSSCKKLTMKDLLSNSTESRPQPPTLPNLENLSVLNYNLPDELINPFLTSFGSQLRKLDLPVGHWREGMGNLFKNLTELDVNFHGQPNGVEIPHTGKELISSLVAPNLVKLRVIDCQEKEIGVESDLLKWLRKFPALRYLNIGDIKINLKLYEENSSNGSHEKFPSLEYLCIRDSGKLSFNFLLSFPSLRQLKIQMYPEFLVNDLSIPNTQIKLREQLQTLKIYDSNIWEHLPKLMGVVLSEEQTKTYEFSREQYEKAKQKRGGKSEANCGEFNKPRRKIQGRLDLIRMFSMLANKKKNI